MNISVKVPTRAADVIMTDQSNDEPSCSEQCTAVSDNHEVDAQIVFPICVVEVTSTCKSSMLESENCNDIKNSVPGKNLGLKPSL